MEWEICLREHPWCELAWEELGLEMLVLPGGMKMLGEEGLCPAGIPSWLLSWIIQDVLMGAKPL